MKLIKISRNFHCRFTAKYAKFLPSHIIQLTFLRCEPFTVTHLCTFKISISQSIISGKLKARIGEKCEKPGDKDADKAKVTACLNFVKLYCEVSILRQLILADMASLLSELSELKPTQAHLKTTGNNILHIIKKEQENDKAILAPFADPVNQKEKRYTIAILYTTIEEYKVLNSYMQTLHEKKDGIKKTGDTNVVGGSIFKEYVLGCVDQMLQGICVRFDTTEEYKKLSEIDMDKKFFICVHTQGKIDYGI